MNISLFNTNSFNRINIEQGMGIKTKRILDCFVEEGAQEIEEVINLSHQKQVHFSLFGHRFTLFVMSKLDFVPMINTSVSFSSDIPSFNDRRSLELKFLDLAHKYAEFDIYLSPLYEIMIGSAIDCYIDLCFGDENNRKTGVDVRDYYDWYQSLSIENSQSILSSDPVALNIMYTKEFCSEMKKALQVQINSTPPFHLIG